ncbi:hypothetical protein [Rhodohalobacter mucosus]|uniref:6-bladed beta-propeller protein n=1 Tax=Rhodohalobacter mucosus TaxID=2079485 RepID=A0A316TTE7_9BACT|nr:hypothetical protein [Rhodohalobacter mucosus]PWN07877.1 hypothetical protein DDZ15_02380 [Rhodohalobacter mucosus]
MRSPISYIIVSFVILAGCSGQEESAEQITYSGLPDLQVNQTIEAGESGEYFPSRLNDLFVGRDGSIIVSDWGSNTLEQFSPDGEHVQTVASEGGGPGELPSFFFIADTGNDRFMIEHQGARRDLFIPDENGLYTYSSTVSSDENSGYGYNIIGKKSDSEYYATPRNVIRDVQSLMVNPKDYREGPVVLIDDSGGLIQDSLEMLQTPLPHLTDAGNGGFRVDVIPYRNTDRFHPLPDGGYLLARPDNSRLEFYDMTQTLQRAIELNVVPREITQADMEYAFRDHRDDVIRDIRPRLHDFKPPFLDILASENHLWLHTDNSESGKEFVVLEMDGTPVGKFLLSEFDEVKKAVDNRIYTIHKNPDIGHSVRVYEVAI